MATANMNMATSSSVVNASDLFRIRKGVAPEEKSEAIQERERLRDLSLERSSKWPNTLEAQRERKERAFQERLQQDELERKHMDRKNAIVKAEQRRMQLERSNKMLFDETDRVKAFHGTLLLSDVLQEREAQLKYKQYTKEITQRQERAFVKQQKEALEIAEEMELRKNEAVRQRNLDERDSQLAQLEDVKTKYLKERELNRQEGLALRRMAEQEAVDALAREEAKRAKAKLAHEQTLIANAALKEFKRIEEEKDAEFEKKIEAFATHKEAVLKERKDRAEAKAKAKLEQKDKLAATIAANLMAEREKTEARIAKQHEEAEIAADMREAEHKAWLKREQVAVDSSRRQQLDLKTALKEQARLDEMEFMEQWRIRNQEIEEEERAEVAAIRARNKNHQGYLMRQIERKSANKKAEARAKLQDALASEHNLAEEDMMFDEYAKVVMEEWDRQGKDLKPVVIGLTKSSRKNMH
ncbi:trichohyalin-plectin-homology domain-containing protein [Pseudoscourfieldia marina]